MDEAKLLLSRVDDIVEQYYCGITGYLGFLNETETSLVCSYLRNSGVESRIFGGYPMAIRNFLCIGDCEDSDFPIDCLLISSKGKKKLTHRDFLGSLMGLGIKRECVGDIILLNETDAVVFVRSEITTHIIRDLRYIGREAVSITEYKGDAGSLCAKTEELQIIITSMRLDNFVSSCTKTSRSVATELISSGSVFLNQIEEKKPSRIIKDKGIISIRGYGKYIVGNIIGKTKSGRLVVSVLHYI